MTDQSLGYYGPPLDDFASTESDFLGNFDSIPPSAMLSDGIVDISQPEPLMYFHVAMSENGYSLQPQMEPNYGSSGSGTVAAESVGSSKEALEKALEALKNDPALGFKKASRLYGVSVSKLHSHTIRRGIRRKTKGLWDNAALKSALEEIRRGCTIADTSAAFGISQPTLYKYCKQNGITVPQPNYDTATMKSALEEIRRGGTVPATSAKYNIPKSTLYTHCKLNGIAVAQHSHDTATVKSALEEIRRGGTVPATSAKYNISKTTLYTHCKLNGIAVAQPNRSWSEEDMAKAIEAVRTGSIKNWLQAARHWKVPYDTLYNRLKRANLSITLVRKKAQRPSDGSQVN